MNESTDATDTVQVAIFNCGVGRNFTILEELASIVALKVTTQGSDLHSCLIDIL